MDITNIGEYNPYAGMNKVDKSSDLPDNKNVQEKISKETFDASSHDAATNISMSSKTLQRYMQEKNEDYQQAPELNLSSFQVPNRDVIKELEQEERWLEIPYNEGTAERYIFDKLNDKVENAYKLAAELANMVLSPNNEDMESRVIDRETGVKLAEYIAQNYLNDPAEANSFLEGVNNYVKKAEMRDKGYVVSLNSDIDPIKPYEMKDESEGYVKGVFEAYAEKYHGTEAQELTNDSGKMETIFKAFTYDMQHNANKLDGLKNEIIRTFEKNEKDAQNTIDKIQQSISKVEINDKFFTNMNDTLSSLNRSQPAGWTNMLSLLKI